MNNKETGSFYTPHELIEYMISYIRARISPGKILEPSAGDGRFAEPLKSFDAKVSLVEFDTKKAENLTSNFSGYCNICCSDFIKYANQSNETFDLIIGNPPYIAKKNIPEEQCEETEKILRYFQLDKSIFQNLWVAFVLASMKLLSNKGAIFFVLPFEFLQVQYAEKLRGFLETRFNTIEIITFEEQVFKEIEQDICLVYLANEQQAKPYIQYTTLSDVVSQNQVLQSVIMRNKPLKKWSNCILNDEETETLSALAKKFMLISEFGDISPGIVTGANSFFILPKQEIDKLKISKTYILPIITKASIIPKLLLLKTADFKKTFTKKNRTHLLNLSKLKETDFSKELQEYLQKGEEEEINKGYKCKSRKRWYDVPIIEKGDVCFFKRYHDVPRVIVNKAGIHTTDIVYNIRLKEVYKAESFAFCFYNSLTLALCEYYGRFYGGGVGELVPSEFKQLSLPYIEIETRHIETVDKMFRNGADINEIIDYVDNIVLKNLSNKEINLLQQIRGRYLKRRLKR